MPPQQAAAISTTNGTSSGLFDGGRGERLACVAQHGFGRGHRHQLGRHVLRAEQRDDHVDVGQRVEEAARVGDVLERGRAALAAVVGRTMKGSPPALWKRHAHLPNVKAWRAIAMIELVVRRDVLHPPLDRSGKIPRRPRPGSRARAASRWRRSAQADADLFEQPEGGFFDAIQLPRRTGAGCADGRSTLTPSLRRGRIHVETCGSDSI